MGTVKLEVEKTDVNVIDAAGRGTGEGLHLALNVGAMLISFLALVALLNALLGASASAPACRSSWTVTLARTRSTAQPAGDSRLGVRADRVGAWACRGATRRHRRPARHAHGAERVRRLLAARRAQGDARSALVHDRHLRAVRLRQLQLDRHPDRRHRRAGADAAARPGAARRARDDRRHAGQLRHRDDRGSCCCDAGAATTRVAEAAKTRSRSGSATCRTSRSCSARASATFAGTLADAIVVPYATSRTGRRRGSSATPASWSPARVERPARARAVGPRALLRRPRPCGR